MTYYMYSKIFIFDYLDRGDTFSIDCENLGLESRLDLRVIMESETDGCEALTGEFASTKTTITGKMYKDKLKSIQVSKCHLNAVLQKLTYLPSGQVSKIRIPIIQSMGQNLSLKKFIRSKQLRMLNTHAHTKYFARREMEK